MIGISGWCRVTAGGWEGALSGDGPAALRGVLPPALEGVRYFEPLPRLDRHAAIDVAFSGPPGLVAPSGPLEPAWRLAAVLGPDLRRREGARADVFLRPGEEPEGLLAGAEAALEGAGRLLGPLPYGRLLLVSGDPSRQGGCSLGPGLAAFHGAVPQDAEGWWPWIGAHEALHQYFGEAVREADRPGWVWLALGLYLERLCLPEAPRLHRRLVDAWLLASQAGLETCLARWPTRPSRQPELQYGHAVLHGKALALMLAGEALRGPESMRQVVLRAWSGFRGRDLGRAGLESIWGDGAAEFFRAWVDEDRLPADLPGFQGQGH